MNATLTLARAELTMLARNRVAAMNAVVLPLALGIMWVASEPPADYAAFGAVLQVLMVLCFTVASGATATLVARRQQRVLERWRISTTTTPSLLFGTLAPPVLLLNLQAGILLAATAYATGTTPTHPVLLVLAVELAGALGCALAFVMATITRTVEAATVTVLPIVAAIAGGGVWATTNEPGEATWMMLATGGGAIAETVRLGWGHSSEPGTTADVLGAAWPSILVLVALTTGAALIALRTFRWHARG